MANELRDTLAPTGTLRVVINLGNPVLAQGTPDAPTGVTVEIAQHLAEWLDVQLKRNVVLTFGGGVDEIQRELIASAGLGLPRVPR